MIIVVCLQVVRLRFIRFAIEIPGDSCFDKLNIYDGNSTEAPLIGSHCGSGLPNDTTSSTNSVFVYFTSDGSVQEAGFRIQYMAMEKLGKTTIFLLNVLQIKVQNQQTSVHISPTLVNLFFKSPFDFHLLSPLSTFKKK